MGMEKTGRPGAVRGAAAVAGQRRAYCAYGYQAFVGAPFSGFNGEWFDIHAKGYVLGNGYRLYSPVLRRFTSPDSLSPFAEGGLGAYSYCGGDPVNREDPSGHAVSWSGFLKLIGWRKPTGLTQLKLKRALLKAENQVLEQQIKNQQLKQKLSWDGQLSIENQQLSHQLAVARFFAAVNGEIVNSYDLEFRKVLQDRFPNGNIGPVAQNVRYTFFDKAVGTVSGGR